MRYYVYAHAKPDGEIFYIGKGTEDRAWRKRNRNIHWNRIAAKYGFNVVILADKLNEIDAINEEAIVISHFKKFGKLSNILDRGDINPMSDLIIKEKHKNAVIRGELHHMKTDKYKKHLSFMLSGNNHPNFGKKRPEHAAKMTGRKLSEETKLKIANSRLGKKYPRTKEVL